MTVVKVKASVNYEIKVAPGLMCRCGELTSEIKKPCPAVLVSDDIVYGIYGETVKASYMQAGFLIKPFIFPNGEQSKNIGIVEALLEFMAKEEITRNGLIIALGGGVTGDIAGFAAAIYLRGVPYLQIPTSFLAAVDSSVGGKTGVDLNAGKNLAGAFNQPIAVFCDTDAFKTLSSKIFNDGLCEVIKYGCISNKALFDKLLHENIGDKLKDIVVSSVAIKRDIVERDEFDRNKRQFLNFGHTAGHAIERLSNYTVTHGHAIAIGMRIMANITGYAEPLKEVYQKYGIESECPYTSGELAQKALSDKKRKGDMITLVLLEGIGKAYLQTVHINELEGIFERGLAG